VRRGGELVESDWDEAIGTSHMDGDTRLCTATAAAALKASFGTDGQPGC
jgi:anaerobic selenocysteine-containing dehydrogenase